MIHLALIAYRCLPETRQLKHMEPGMLMARENITEPRAATCSSTGAEGQRDLLRVCRAFYGKVRSSPWVRI